MSRDAPMALPTVSVIIPAFNVEKYICEAISSALSQSVEDIEIIVVNDGSTDGTAEAVAGFCDQRLKLLEKLNSGCASARNTGIVAARAEFVSFLDGDDFWETDKLEHELAVLKNSPKLDMVFSLSNLVSESGESLGLLNPIKNQEYCTESLIIENPVGNGSAVLMRKAVFNEVGLFDESLVASSDIDMWIRVARLRFSNIACIPKILTHYRRRGTQATANHPRIEMAYEQVMDKCRREDPEMFARLEARSRCNKYRYLAFLAYEAGALKDSARQLFRSFKASKKKFVLDSRSWLMLMAILAKCMLPRNLHDRLFIVALAIRGNRFRTRYGRKSPDLNCI